MITGLLSLLAVGGSASPPPMFHAIAFVNDPLSHGTLGDHLLSLNEAIQLHNGTLLQNQLSALEQFQLSQIPGTGGTTDITWVDIDAEFTGTITIQQDLDPIITSPFGLLIRGNGGVPVLDFSGANITRGIRSISNNLVLQDVALHGGPYGLDVEQDDSTGQPGCTLVGVEFVGQSQFGVRVVGTEVDAIGRLIFEDCTFENMPKAIEFDDSLADRTTIFEATNVRITNVVDAFDLAIGAGGTAQFTFDRVVIESSGTGIDLSAAATNGRPTFVEGLHTRVRSPMCVRIEAADDAVTWVQCGMWSLLPPAGGTALQLGAVGSQVYGDLNEFRCDGDVAIETGAAALPLQVRNLRCTDGAVTLSTTAAQAVTVSESRFVDCTTESSGSGPVLFDGCSFEGGAVGLATAAGMLVTSGCFVDNAGFGVSANQSLPQAQLGSIEVSPDDVSPGSMIQFQADLPPGLVCAFVLGVVASAPLAPFPSPYYVYVDPLAFVFLPGVYVGQQSTSWTAPLSGQFRGVELLVQAAVLPLPGSPAPAVQMPPGWRFVIR